ncbi:protein LURP-one-related 14 isoform X2 [Carica papaya]|uniref:protein LURP-one-related 14 isoform X2 n=1 Tax=Carica papaya TaxID=3649 RepID=UPI000B8C8CF7|nr:protein LURP-one-related 14 isoform X2 [Carica papaya]
MTKQKVEWGVGDPTINVVGDRFCNPHPLELSVKRKMGLSLTTYDVYDVSGNLLLQVDGGVWRLDRKRVMRDPAGFPVLTMRGKALSLRDKWSVYHGESSENSDLIFCAQQSKALKLKSEFDIFLANNLGKEVRDFRTSGSYTNLSFKVYKDNAVIARVNHKYSWKSFKGLDTYSVKVNPEVDYAFIIALLVMIDETEYQS